MIRAPAAPGAVGRFRCRGEGGRRVLDRETLQLLILAAAAGIVGVVAQFGINLALRVPFGAQLAGYILISLVLSAGATVIGARVLGLDPVVSATLGSMLSALPALILLRLVLRVVDRRYDLEAAQDLEAALAESRKPQRRKKVE